MTVQIVVNGRILDMPLTGAQRYLGSNLAHMPSIRVVRPRLPLVGAKGHLWEQAILPRRIQRTDLLWSPSHTGPVHRSRQVVSILDLTPFDHPEWLKPSFVATYRAIVPRVARSARRIIAISEFTKQRVVEVLGEPPEKIEVIHLGVDGPGDVRRKPCLAAHPEFILVLGSVEPRKNLGRILAAWNEVHDRMNGRELWIAGDVGTPRVFRNSHLPAPGPRVRFLGRVTEEERRHLLSCATALLYPSLYEGFGLPPLEAMAWGCPVVTSNVTSMPEVVGDAALLVDPGSVSSLAAAMMTCRDEAQMNELRRRGPQRAARFSWKEGAGRTFRVLHEVAQEFGP